jgi:hypothetical protein
MVISVGSTFDSEVLRIVAKQHDGSTRTLDVWVGPARTSEK